MSYYNPSHKENHYETWRSKSKHKTEQLTYCFEQFYCKFVSSLRNESFEIMRTVVNKNETHSLVPVYFTCSYIRINNVAF